MNIIDISSKNKAKVLAALWNNSKQQGMGFMDISGASSVAMTTEDAEELLRERTYFDYLRGRVMKIDLSTDELRPGLYDRDNGEGAAAAAIAGIK